MQFGVGKWSTWSTAACNHHHDLCGMWCGAEREGLVAVKTRRLSWARVPSLLLVSPRAVHGAKGSPAKGELVSACWLNRSKEGQGELLPKQRWRGGEEAARPAWGRGSEKRGLHFGRSGEWLGSWRWQRGKV